VEGKNETADEIRWVAAKPRTGNQLVRESPWKGGVINGPARGMIKKLEGRRTGNVQRKEGEGDGGASGDDM